jgi:alpha-galactosidase
MTSYKASIEAHGTLLLELGETVPAGIYQFDGYEYLPLLAAQ